MWSKSDSSVEYKWQSIFCRIVKWYVWPCEGASQWCRGEHCHLTAKQFSCLIESLLCGVCVPFLCPYRLSDRNLKCEWEGFVLSHFWKIVCKFKVRFSEQQFFCVCVSIFKAHSVKFRVDSTHSPLCKNMLTVQLCFAAALTTVSAENSCEIRLHSSVSLLKKWRHLQYKHCPVTSEVKLILTVTNLIILIYWTKYFLTF